MNSDLLPKDSSTAWERAMANSLAVPQTIASAITSMRRVKYISPRVEMLPFLVYEYGLGELTPYVPNLYQLIDQGVRWQRIRGTISAIAVGLAWIGYTATVEEAWNGRRWWNSFQLRFNAIPENDYPDLERIEGITGLSVPIRSQLRRGVFGYDVEAAQANHSRFNRAMWNFESGTSITEAGTLWSFGRCHHYEHTMTELEGILIDNWIEHPVPDNLQWGDGNWIDPTEDSGSVRWSDLASLKWLDADFLWNISSEGQRRASLAAWFPQQVIYMEFRRPNGSVIGYRRCRAVHTVRPSAVGPYRVGEDRYDVQSGAEEVYIEAMTGFDDVDRIEAGSVAIYLGGELAPGIPPGRLWLEPEDIGGGISIAEKPLPVLLRRTVREQIKILMRF